MKVNISCVWILLTLQVFLVFSQIISYGPSLDELTHHRHRISLLPPSSSSSSFSGAFHEDKTKRNKSVIFLSDYLPTLSVLVPLLPGKFWANQSEAVTHFENIRYGEFDVRAPRNFGVIAVIQFLKLATVFGIKPAKCLDYIAFSDDDSLETDDSIKICGEISNNENSIRQPENLIGPRTFIAPSGNLTLKMFLVSMMIQSEWRNGGQEKQIAVEIAFTAFPLSKSKSTSSNSDEISKDSESNNKKNEMQLFSGCPKFTVSSDGIQIQDQSQTQNENANGAKLVFWRCSKHVKNSCIHRRLFCDQIVQCGFSHASNSDSISLFGQDELDCNADANSNDYDDSFYNDDYFDLSANNTNTTKFYQGKPIFNGTRKVHPKIVINEWPWEVYLTEGIVVFLAVIFFLVFICWIFICFRRLWHSKRFPNSCSKWYWK